MKGYSLVFINSVSKHMVFNFDTYEDAITEMKRYTKMGKYDVECEVNPTNGICGICLVSNGKVIDEYFF